MNSALVRRKPNENKILEVKSLTTADLDLLRQPAGPVEPLKTIRERHHHIAWLMALGRSNLEIAAELRMSPGRVSQHRADPSIKDLVAKKFADIEAGRREAAVSFSTSMIRGRDLAEQEINRRLEAEPEKVSFRDLNRHAVDRMDRTGFPKHTTSDSRNINVNFAASLEAAISRSRKAIT